MYHCSRPGSQWGYAYINVYGLCIHIFLSYGMHETPLMLCMVSCMIYKYI